MDESLVRRTGRSEPGVRSLTCLDGGLNFAHLPTEPVDLRLLKANLYLLLVD